MYISISLLVLIISYCLFKKASGSLDIRRPNMASFVFYVLLATTFVGSIGVLYNIGPQDYVPEDASLRVWVWISAMYTMIMVPVGMLLACVILRVRRMKVLFSRYQSSPLQSQFTLSENTFKISLFFVSALSALAVGFIVLSENPVPLFELLRGNNDYWYLAKLRSSPNSSMGSNVFLRMCMFLLGGFSSVMAFTSYAYWKKDKKPKFLMWFICMALAAGFLATYNLEKGPIFFFLLGLYLTHVAISRKIKAKTLLVLIVALLLLFGLLSITVQGVLQGTGKQLDLLVTFATGVKAAWSRIVFGQLVGLYMCFDIFPNLHPHLWFSTTGRLIHEVFGLAYRPDYGIITMMFFRPELVEKGVAGHQTTVFIGEAWANFGILGILFFPSWIGFFVQSFHILFLKLKKTPYNLALYVQLTLLLPITSGVKGFYYPVWVFQYFFLAFVVLFLALMLRSVRKSLETGVHP